MTVIVVLMYEWIEVIDCQIVGDVAYLDIDPYEVLDPSSRIEVLLVWWLCSFPGCVANLSASMLRSAAWSRGA